MATLGNICRYRHYGVYLTHESSSAAVAAGLVGSPPGGGADQDRNEEDEVRGGRGEGRGRDQGCHVGFLLNHMLNFS